MRVREVMSLKEARPSPNDDFFYWHEGQSLKTAPRYCPSPCPGEEWLRSHFAWFDTPLDRSSGQA